MGYVGSGVGRSVRKPKVEVKELSREERLAEIVKREAELDKQIKEYEDTHRIEFFQPFFYQEKVLEHIHGGKKVVTLQGGNGIGKTVLGACIVGSACLGIEPWSKKETIFGRRPVTVRILCSDWEKHAATVIVPKLKEWLPIGEYTTAKNNVGVESKFTFRNKSTIELITNKQETSDHEGWEGDLVWGDEPFGQDKYVANLRGLRKEVGLFLITMTAVKESWMLDEIVLNTSPAFASVTEIPMSANPTLPKDYQDMVLAAFGEKERIARIEGKWLNLVGLVWKDFDKGIHVIDPFHVPTDWPVFAMIDYHPSHPNAILYCALDNFDRMYVIDETWGNLSPEQVGDDIVRKRSQNAWRMTDVFIDPLSKGDMTYIKNRGLDIPDTFSVLKERLWHHGIELFVASKDKSSGIRNVEKMLVGPNKTPTLFFFRDLNKIEKEGIIWEIQRWTYDDRNLPRDENDHFCESLYRATLTGIKYTKIHRTGLDVKAETNFDVFQPNYGILSPTEKEFNVWDT
jgi:hypothetical protein